MVLRDVMEEKGYLLMGHVKIVLTIRECKEKVGNNVVLIFVVKEKG